ncbi:MAG: 1-acyl-sn-glycerol-3-phosphate acyltransferase [Chloroflexota bacterium]|nr:1-acyl-sn-glycerol-3-phosphate acyltransferase [Chloroflexota bacterium]
MRVGAPEWPERRLWLWRLLYPPIRALALFLAPVRFVGAERLPPSGGFILIANHISWMDPPWIEFALGRAIRFMAKQELFELPILGFLLRGIGCFPVRRGEADREAMATALRVLAAGHAVGFFPEGHRSPNAALLRAHPGIVLLARRSAAPLVPLAITGSDRARLGRFWRRDITIRVGEPFRVTDLPESAGRDREAVADAVMRRIAALLPSDMRGAYG